MEKYTASQHLPPLPVRPYRLSNEIQHYAWGSRGAKALIPRLLNITEPGTKPYAEYWMGAHPKAPSRITLQGKPVSLFDLVRDYPLQILGTESDDRGKSQFPFLFKLLSAAEPLSIQVHPTLAQAAELQRSDPAHYPDTNTKPEIAIALDSLTALVGFQPISDLQQTFQQYPELAEFIGPSQIEQLSQSESQSRTVQTAALAQLFRNCVNRVQSDPTAYAALLGRLRKRLENMTGTSGIARLFLQLSHKYSDNDIGLITIFLLNWVELSAGQAIYTPPGILHAYVQGNIIECMANSDNVIRAGLTPKFVDIDNLLKVVDFQPGAANILEPAEQYGIRVYTTPAAEFELTRYQLRDCNRKSINHQNTPEILFVLDGGGNISWDRHTESGILPLQQGDSVLIPAALDQYELVAGQEMVLFRAAVPGGLSQ